MNSMPNKILVRGLELIESGWTQGAYARDADGNVTYSGSCEACSWCAAGARNKAAEELDADFDESRLATMALSDAALLTLPQTPQTPKTLLDYNDSHTKAEVVAAFQRAIKATL